MIDQICKWGNEDKPRVLLLRRYTDPKSGDTINTCIWTHKSHIQKELSLWPIMGHLPIAWRYGPKGAKEGLFHLCHNLPSNHVIQLRMPKSNNEEGPRRNKKSFYFEIQLGWVTFSITFAFFLIRSKKTYSCSNTKPSFTKCVLFFGVTMVLTLHFYPEK